MKETNLVKTFAEAKLLANKRSEIQQKKYVEFWESKKKNNLNKTIKDESKS